MDARLHQFSDQQQREGEKYPHVVQLSSVCNSNRPCWLLEVSTMDIYRAPRSSSRQMKGGQAVEIFPGDHFLNHLN